MTGNRNQPNHFRLLPHNSQLALCNSFLFPYLMTVPEMFPEYLVYRPKITLQTNFIAPVMNLIAGHQKI